MNYNYDALLTNSKFVKDNVNLLSSLFGYKNDSMMEFCSNRARVMFAIDNSIELLNEIRHEVQKGTELTSI